MWGSLAIGNAARARSPQRTTIDISIRVERDRLIAASMNPIIGLAPQPLRLRQFERPQSGLPLRIRDRP